VEAPVNCLVSPANLPFSPGIDDRDPAIFFNNPVEFCSVAIDSGEPISPFIDVNVVATPAKSPAAPDTIPTDLTFPDNAPGAPTTPNNAPAVPVIALIPPDTAVTDVRDPVKDPVPPFEPVGDADPNKPENVSDIPDIIPVEPATVDSELLAALDDANGDDGFDGPNIPDIADTPGIDFNASIAPVSIELDLVTLSFDAVVPPVSDDEENKDPIESDIEPVTPDNVFKDSGGNGPIASDTLDSGPLAAVSNPTAAVTDAIDDAGNVPGGIDDKPDIADVTVSATPGMADFEFKIAFDVVVPGMDNMLSDTADNELDADVTISSDVPCKELEGILDNAPIEPDTVAFPFDIVDNEAADNGPGGIADNEVTVPDKDDIVSDTEVAADGDIEPAGIAVNDAMVALIESMLPCTFEGGAITYTLL